ncbi:MAG: response regulator, partial [Gammaproteobacteria bacterium]
RIKQILINYIGNAIKFSEHERIVIRATISLNSKQENVIKISVKDKGIGISEYDKCLLFSPFNQLDDTDTKQHSGTGLGLAISKSLAEAIGGEVGVESELGKGSTFWFSFLYKSNITVDTFPNNNPIRNKNTSEGNIYNGLNGKNILIAEDNEINAKLIKTILENKGVNIHHAWNGKEAFDIYVDSAIDLIIMDIHMPVMNGLDATKHIRNIEKFGRHIPIIGLTANAINEDKIRYESSGMDAILLKPIAVDSLLFEIKHLIGKHEPNIHANTNNSETVSFNGSSDTKTGDELNHLGVNLNLVSSLRNMLIDELPKIKIQLSAHFSSKNWKVLREHIHKLLGGTAYCDVPGLRNATMSFQTSLKEESNSLEDDFELLLSEIDALTAM